jgi:PPOX class probable F420-dependent enzyme
VSSISPELRDLIDSGPLAHVVTVQPDGTPHVTIVWIGLDGDDIVSGHLGMYKKLRNVRHDPRVVISIEAPRRHGVYLAEHAVIYGTGSVEEGGAVDLLKRLGHIYVESDFDFPEPANPTPEYVLRTKVERVAGVGPWVTKSE